MCNHNKARAHNVIGKKKNAARLVIIASVRLRKSAVCFSASANFSSVLKIRSQQKKEKKEKKTSGLMSPASLCSVFPF